MVDYVPASPKVTEHVLVVGRLQSRASHSDPQSIAQYLLGGRALDALGWTAEVRELEVWRAVQIFFYVGLTRQINYVTLGQVFIL